MAAVTISRKLFPITTGTYQQPTNCSACPYDCPFDCYGIPDFFFSPPPPSPPSPSDHQTHLQPLPIVLIALFVILFFAFTFYTIIVKCRSQGTGGNRVTEPPESDGGVGGEGNQIDHPIWYITTAGLQQSVINSIRVIKFKKNEGLIEVRDCCVCLSEFEEGEMVRLLPKCSHAFHIGCVDTWLATHTTCPLCRANIVADFSRSNSIRGLDLDRVNQIEETQIENLENLGVENRGGGSVDEQSDIEILIVKDGEIDGNEIVRRNNVMDSSS